MVACIMNTEWLLLLNEMFTDIAIKFKASWQSYIELNSFTEPITNMIV